MAYNKNLYSSDTDALDAGIIYDQNEQKMQDEINAAIKNGDLIVGQADNLASKMNQFSTGEFIERTTGGDASLSDGDGHLVLIRGNMVHTGHIAKSVSMTVTPIERDPSAGELTATIDNDVFLAEMEPTSGTFVFTYESNGWDYNPSNYGITINGLALPGDEISVTYQKEVLGTITQSNPKSFYSTGWNLYDHELLRAKVVRYSDTYGFGVSGTYTQLMFSETLDGEAETITVTNGRFTIPSNGYVFVIGGNSTDTAIWMTWSDWTEGYVGDFKVFEESEIDLEDIMTEYFPNGLMAVGSYQDEIDLSLGKATNNVARIAYTAENLDDVIELGVEYDYDDSYIYYGLTTPVVNTIELDNLYAASDHGIEYYTVTQVPIYTQTLYGVNLKNRLERDVVTISQQTLSPSEQAQVTTNIGAVNKATDNLISGKLSFASNTSQTYPIDIGMDMAWNSTPVESNNRYIRFRDNGGSVNPPVVQDIGALRGYIARASKVVDNETVYVPVTGIQMYAKANGVTNGLALRVLSDGTREVQISDGAAPIWRDTLGTISRAGDTMRGTIIFNGTGYNTAVNIDNPTYDARYTPAEGSTGTTKYINFRDKNQKMIAQFAAAIGTSGNTGVQIVGERPYDEVVDGVVTTKYYVNALSLYTKESVVDGETVRERVVTVSEQKPWRKAIGFGQPDGNYPITVAQGGTGGTSTTAALASLGAYDFKTKGTALASGDNVDTGLTNGITYYSLSGTVSAALAGTPPSTASGFKIIQDVPYGTNVNNYKYQFAATSTGLRWRLTNSTATWSNWHSILTDEDSLSAMNTAATVFTKASGYNVTSAAFRRWGKVAMVKLVITKTTAVTSATGMTLGTLNIGYRPAIDTTGGSNTSTIPLVQFIADGSLTIYGTWPTAGAAREFYATFLLP